MKVLDFKLLRNNVTEDAGLIIQQNVTWLGSSPDGRIKDQYEIPSHGLTESKYSQSKRNQDINDLVQDDSFLLG